MGERTMGQRALPVQRAAGDRELVGDFGGDSLRAKISELCLLCLRAEGAVSPHDIFQSGQELFGDGVATELPVGQKGPIASSGRGDRACQVRVSGHTNHPK